MKNIDLLKDMTGIYKFKLNISIKIFKIRKTWEPLEVYICAIFLLPIRIIIIILSLSFLSFVSFLCICTNEDTAEIEFSTFKRGFFKICIRMA